MICSVLNPVQQFDVVVMLRLQAADLCGSGVLVLGCEACLLCHLEPLPVADGVLRSSQPHR
jgi:hypothetical protein